jgi:hypothetical protein
MPLLWLPVLALLPVAAKPPAKIDTDTLVQAARPIVAAVVAAGRENLRRARPLKGDELTRFYIRAAVKAARRLPESRSAPALLLGIGVALDTSALLRSNPVTAAVWKRVESDAERSARLKVLGTPTMHDRHDLAQHFVVSAALTAVSGAKAAEAAGILKELLDAEPGGSGFSFADLASDLSGVAFAQRLLAAPEQLKALETTFTVADFALPPAGLTEGLSQSQFEKRFGSIRDERFRKELATLRKKIKELPGHR